MAGQGATDAPGMFERAANYLAAWGAEKGVVVRTANGAVPGTTSHCELVVLFMSLVRSFCFIGCACCKIITPPHQHTKKDMSACANLHVPADADVVLVEYSVSDADRIEPPFDNPVR